jgi:polysaccharide export outer membrane protein
MQKDMHMTCASIGAAAVALVLWAGASNAQTSTPVVAPAAPPPAATTAASPVTASSAAPVVAPPGAKAAAAAIVPPPPGYVIGADDVLSIIYWRDKDMTADVSVRPDGVISLPLLNEVVAAGLTPAQLRDRLMEESQKYMEDANVTVVVKQINSRKVYITGQVGKIGSYPLTGPMTVLQLLSMVGGLGEYANSKNIVILRTENGRQVSHRFNYKEVASGKKLTQNIELKPGDTVIVP